MQTKLLTLDPPPIGAYLDVIAPFGQYSGPAQFMRQAMGQASAKTVSVTHGKVFELAFCEVLKQEGITPFYYQAKMPGRPVIDFDVILLQDNNRPISFSLKTSLRERWKQSYLEAVVLRGTYPASVSYLVTLSRNEAQRRKDSIKRGETPELADCVVAVDNEFDSLIYGLRSQSFVQVQRVTQFTGREVL